MNRNPTNQPAIILYERGAPYHPHLSPETNRLLSTPITQEEKFEFENRIKDNTSYPYIETNISLNDNSFSFKAFLSDGRDYSYSKRGEQLRYSECRGEICVILTQKNILAIGNSSIGWANIGLHNELHYKVKLGVRAGFVVSERNIYFYNLYSNIWEKIGLEQEVVHAVANKNDLATIITSRRIIAINLSNGAMTEQTLTVRNVNRFEIKENFINFFTGAEIYIYEANSEMFTQKDILN
ncbi:hypothetical protein P3G55_02015 [Leptospira sp. 96542]|nr:hypothetical protein [Leptospira sp. 96542]